MPRYLILGRVLYLATLREEWNLACHKCFRVLQIYSTSLGQNHPVLLCHLQLAKCSRVWDLDARSPGHEYTLMLRLFAGQCAPRLFEESKSFKGIVIFKFHVPNSSEFSSFYTDMFLNLTIPLLFKNEVRLFRSHSSTTKHILRLSSKLWNSLTIFGWSIFLWIWISDSIFSRWLSLATLLFGMILSATSLSVSRNGWPRRHWYTAQ